MVFSESHETYEKVKLLQVSDVVKDAQVDRPRSPARLGEAGDDMAVVDYGGIDGWRAASPMSAQENLSPSLAAGFDRLTPSDGAKCPH